MSQHDHSFQSATVRLEGLDCLVQEQDVHVYSPDEHVAEDCKITMIPVFHFKRKRKKKESLDDAPHSVTDEHDDYRMLTGS